VSVFPWCVNILVREKRFNGDCSSHNTAACQVGSMEIRFSSSLLLPSYVAVRAHHAMLLARCNHHREASSCACEAALATLSCITLRSCHMLHALVSARTPHKQLYQHTSCGVPPARAFREWLLRL
jgi:hypothetical protein